MDRPSRREFGILTSSHALVLVITALGLLGCASTWGGGPGPGQMNETDRIFLMAAGTWDSDHDGQVTCAEWQGYLNELVASADKSRDGALNVEEFATLVRTDRLFAAADFTFWDTDHDGKVTREDMVARPNPAITLLDRDKNCVLTDTELAVARPLQNAPGPQGGPRGGGPSGGPGSGGGPPGGGSPGGGGPG